MTRQWKRRCSLVLAGDEQGLDVSDLHIEFEIRAMDLQTPNTALIRIWNPADQTVQRAMKEFTRLILKCGYEGGALGKIFDGSVIQAKAGKASATDSYLDVIAAEGDQAYCNAVVRVSLAAGATQADIAKAAIAAMGEHDVTEGYVPDDLGKSGLPRGVVLFGMARDTLNDVATTTGSKWSIQQGEAQIVPDDAALPNSAVVLTSRTGLIGRPEQTQEGIKARCLLNPEIKMGGLVQINNASINQATLQTSLQGELANSFLPRLAEDGFYKVILANHVGNTRGNDWYSDLICIALGDVTTQALVQRGY